MTPVVKQSEPMRVALAAGVAPAAGPEALGPVFAELLPRVARHVTASGSCPGMSFARYERSPQSTLTVWVGFVIGDQSVPDSDEVQVADLPVVTVASVAHRGAMQTLPDTFGQLEQWIAENGYRVAGGSREIYREWHPEDPARHVTELQIPVDNGTAPGP